MSDTNQQSSRIKKAVGWGVLTILVGAIGSGLWDVVLKPVGSALPRYALTAVTLGLESARNSIYTDVAKGHHEVPSLHIFLFIVVLIFCSQLFVILGLFMGTRSNRGAAESSGLRQEYIAGVRKRLYLLAVVGLFLASILVAQFIKINYTNLAITHYEQLLRACRPYVSSDQRERFESKFAQVRTRQDYVSVVSDLRQVAATHSVQAPDFSIW